MHCLCMLSYIYHCQQCDITFAALLPVNLCCWQQSVHSVVDLNVVAMETQQSVLLVLLANMSVSVI